MGELCTEKNGTRDNMSVAGGLSMGAIAAEEYDGLTCVIVFSMIFLVRRNQNGQNHE